MSDDLSLLKQEPKTAPVLGGDLYRFLPFVQVISFLNSHLIFVKFSLKVFEGEFSQDNIGVGWIGPAFKYIGWQLCRMGKLDGQHLQKKPKKRSSRQVSYAHLEFWLRVWYWLFKPLRLYHRCWQVQCVFLRWTQLDTCRKILDDFLETPVEQILCNVESLQMDMKVVSSQFILMFAFDFRWRLFWKETSLYPWIYWVCSTKRMMGGCNSCLKMLLPNWLHFSK